MLEVPSTGSDQSENSICDWQVVCLRACIGDEFQAPAPANTRKTLSSEVFAPVCAHARILWRVMGVIERTQGGALYRYR